jgi:subtilisin family serine protease
MKKIYCCLILFCVVGQNATRVFGEGYVKDEIFVRFEDNATENQKLLLLSKFELQEKTKFILTKSILYKIKSGKDPLELIPLLTKNSLVKYADLNSKGYFLESSSSNEPFFQYQWSLSNKGQNVNWKSGLSDADIDWSEAMSIYKGKKKTGVAVIDSGVSIDHPELKDRLGGVTMERNGIAGYDDDGYGYIDDGYGWDFFDDDNVPNDLRGHGTQVAGIISASPYNNLGVSGVAPDSFVIPLRVFGESGGATDEDIVKAAGYAISLGVRIVNLSLGGPREMIYRSSSIQEAITDLEKNYDVLLICAAGNGGIDGIGDDIDKNPTWPASYEGKAILSVTAVNQVNELTPFSNFGLESVDIAAPGSNILAPTVSRKIESLETFESQPTNWQFGYGFGNMSNYSWRYFVDRFGNTWATDSDYNANGDLLDYSPFTDTYMTSPIIDLSIYNAPRLEVSVFHDLAYSYFSSNDYLIFEISVDGGYQWHYLRHVTGKNLLIPDFVQNQYQTGKYIFDLSKFKSEHARIRFRLKTDGLYQSDGVYIDNFAISDVTSLSNTGPQYDFVDGTSFAAPIVSGVAALVLSHRPELSALDVREILLQSVTKVDGLKDRVSSSGVVNAFNALTLADTWIPRSANPRTFTFTIGGNVLPAGKNAGNINGLGTYEAGKQLNLRAVPSDGYTFSHWTGGASGSENPLQYTVIADTEIIANFEKSTSPTVPLWSDSSDLSHGWKSFEWFGSFWESSTPWVYHVSLGWLYRVGDELSSLWFYNQEKGWMYTSSSAFPYLYLNENQSWSYVSVGRIYSYKTNSWSSL